MHTDDRRPKTKGDNGLGTQLRGLCCLLLVALGCAACGAPPPAPAANIATPTPTIAAAPRVTTTMPISATPTPQIAVQLAAPTGSAATAVPAEAASFAYLFPAYVPDGMRVSPNESRVARENEIGTTAGGFYLVTLNGDQRKLVVGGGSTDALPVGGEQRQVTYDGATALLTTNGEQRQLVFVRDKAKYFVYGRGISEQELLLIAESMVPMDLAALRDLAAGR